MEQSDLVRENRILRLMTAKLDEEKSCLDERLTEMTEKASRIEANCANIVTNAQTVLRTLYPRLRRELQREKVAFMKRWNAELKEKNALFHQRTKDLQEARWKLEFAEKDLEESDETVRVLNNEKKLLIYENTLLKSRIKEFFSFKSRLDQVEERMEAIENNEPLHEVINRLIEERLVELGFIEKGSEGSAAERKQNLLETGSSASKKFKCSGSTQSQSTHFRQATHESSISSPSDEQLSPHLLNVRAEVHALLDQRVACIAKEEAM